MSIPTTKLPWLLYAYPWMPFPRRVIIYLREKRIPNTVVQVVHVSDPQAGNSVVPSQANTYPPRPEGSLPILAIPPTTESESWTYIRQSLAIINYLEEATSTGGALFTLSISLRPLSQPTNPLTRARHTELLALADQLTTEWNPIRTLGTGAGTLNYPAGARELLRWLYRTLHTVNSLLTEQNPDLTALAADNDDNNPVRIADIVLFQFLEFTHDCYGLDVTRGTGAETTDVYGRTRKDEYPVLSAWYHAFKKRESTRRDGEGERPAPEVLERMSTWYDGVL